MNENAEEKSERTTKGRARWSDRCSVVRGENTPPSGSWRENGATNMGELNFSALCPLGSKKIEGGARMSGGLTMFAEHVRTQVVARDLVQGDALDIEASRGGDFACLPFGDGGGTDSKRSSEGALSAEKFDGVFECCERHGAYFVGNA